MSSCFLYTIVVLQIKWFFLIGVSGSSYVCSWLRTMFYVFQWFCCILKWFWQFVYINGSRYLYSLILLLQVKVVQNVCMLVVLAFYRYQCCNPICIQQSLIIFYQCLVCTSKIENFNGFFRVTTLIPIKSQNH